MTYMLRTAFLAAALVIRSAAAQPSTEEVLTNLCPPYATYSLDADEVAILNEVLLHYRKAEWSSTRARHDAVFAPADYARHTVPSLESPQLLLQETVRYEPWFDANLRVELQRHGAPPEAAHAMLEAFRAANRQRYVIHFPPITNVISLSCSDKVGRKYGLKRVSGDFTNGSVAVGITRPAFDAERKTALLVAVNSESITELESIFLHARPGGRWQIAWHSNPGAYQPRAAAAATKIIDHDYRVFDAVLAHLRKGLLHKNACVAVVNQTRTEKVPIHESLPSTLPAAAADRERRSIVSLYIGTYTPAAPARLVQREVPGKPGAPCEAAVSFSLPGYAADGSVVYYWLQNAKAEGLELGTGWAILKRVGNDWRVERDSYQRSMLLAR